MDKCNTPGCGNKAQQDTRYGWQCNYHYKAILEWDKVEQAAAEGVPISEDRAEQYAMFDDDMFD